MKGAAIMETNVLKRLVGVAFVTGVSLAILASPPTTPAAMAQQSEPAANDAKDKDAKEDGEENANDAEPRGPQGCAIKAHRVSKKGAIKGKVTATNCAGWSLKYGMQVHRWHGWTNISGKGPISGKPGKHTYPVKACKKGTFNYRMFIQAYGGLPPAPRLHESQSVRRKC
jgi:hypothetical protein